MKVILDIDDSNTTAFLKLVEGLDYVNILKTISNEKTEQSIQDLVEAFEDVRLHEDGKKQLKSASDLLNGLLA
ncbi:hypothetical protein [Reichenbachiella ulvae]|uniref:Uncharacterized protein n=1 Tax=Reichenbachiella ulvae TaxID=2980104 RepID=A0ABT3CXI9_9BACT|nr:hypothetical protein [Reichenbachiella ulvae]MCV9388200.1 hypothetical protein [Reichenbachiella ulvae]